MYTLSKDDKLYITRNFSQTNWSLLLDKKGELQHHSFKSIFRISKNVNSPAWIFRWLISDITFTEKHFSQGGRNQRPRAKFFNNFFKKHKLRYICFRLYKKAIKNSKLNSHKFSCDVSMIENLHTNWLNFGRHEFS